MTASAFFTQSLADRDPEIFGAITQGVAIPGPRQPPKGVEPASGRLYFQTENFDHPLPIQPPGGSADNGILRVALALSQRHHNVTLVSKDINLRVKSAMVGLRTEDYHNDQVLDDIRLLHSGVEPLPETFWADCGDDMDAWHDDAGRSRYRVNTPMAHDWTVNTFLSLGGERAFEAIVRELNGPQAVLEITPDFRNPQHAIWGINARNTEQNFALHLLMDPTIDFVSLTGIAGSGKTLLALAAGLQQTLDNRQYQEIILTREAVAVGNDIGFLPGTEEEKMTPWMGALMDNLEVLTQHTDNTSSWSRAATNDLLHHRIKIRSLNFMRGRTFNQRYIIIDEAQNLTAKQLKTLITRAGRGSKVVCLGNLAQIDTPYLSETTSGLTYVVDRFRHWAHSGHITLRRGERSRLVDFANDAL